MARGNAYFSPAIAKRLREQSVQPAAETPPRPAEVELTQREAEVLQLIAEGYANKQIAAELGLSVKTAETHRSNIMRKLDLHSVSDLVLYAVRNNIVHVVQASIE